MALFKILKGVEKKDANGKSLMLTPSATNGVPEIHEGWAYVTTDEGNMYVDVTSTKRIKIGATSDVALEAINDSKGQNIAATYIKDMALQNDASAPYYVVSRGDNTIFNLNIPVANASNAGVITTGEQTIAGKKNITGSFVIYGNAADKKLQTRGIVGSDGNGTEGDLYLQYGNSTSDTIYLGSSGTNKIYSNGSQYTGNAATATKATKDSKDQDIASTYIKGLIYDYVNKSIPELKYSFGDNTTDFIAMPDANTTNGGIVTTGAQTFAGNKTFNGSITTASFISAQENITSAKQLISTLADGTAPFVVTSKTQVDNLNANFVCGKSASNDTFTANGASEHVVPTQRAIFNSLNDMLMASQALVYRGLIDPTDKTTYPPTPVTSGSVYVISKEGTFNNQYCEPGDIVIGYYIAATNKTEWDIVQNNINGAVVIKDGGTVNRTDIVQNSVPRFDTKNGRVIKQSLVVIDDSGNILPSTSNTQEIGASTNVWKNIYATNFTGLASNATYDDIGDEAIKLKYIAGISLVNDASAPYYQAYDGTNQFHSTFALPVADSTNAGIITTGAQSINGIKTFNSTGGGIIIPNPYGFNYSGIEEATANAARVVWFADSVVVGKPVKSTKFTFNPGATTKWNNYDSSNPSAYGLLKTDRFEGLALKALQDDMGDAIKKKYVAAMGLTDHGTAPYYTLYDGTNTPFTPTIPLPVASASNAGIITNSTQTITGAKTIDSNGSLTIDGNFYFTGIGTNTSTGARPIWFAHKDRLTTPAYNNDFTFNPYSTVKWDDYDEGSAAPAHELVTVDRIKALAYQALQDDMGATIKKKYFAGALLTNHVTAPYYTFYDGTNTALTTVDIPAATISQAGVITTQAQTLTGHKTINASGSLTLQGASGFTYTGIESGGSPIYRCVWFAHSEKVGTPVFNENFKYNPASTTAWTGYDSKTPSAYGSLSCARFEGISKKALEDDLGGVIKQKYIAGVSLDDKTKQNFTFTLGDNNIFTTLSPLFAASGSCGGSALLSDRLDSFDTRSATRSPQDTPKGLTLNFKSNATIGLSDGGSYTGVMSWRSYGTNGDLTGGYPIEIAYTANKNLFLRLGTSATAWSEWDKVLTAGNFSNRTDGAFSGTANRSEFLETWYQDKTKGTYDQAYMMYAWWEQNDICKLVVDNYKTKVDLANALTVNAGSTSQPVYFSGGVPVAIDWRVGNSSIGERNCNNVTYNYAGYYTSNGPATTLGATTNDGALWSQAYSSSWVAQIAQDYRNGNLFVRGKNNGTWQAWTKVLTVANYTGTLNDTYVKKSGDEMSGMLRVNGAPIFGYRYSASNNAPAFVFDKPSSNYTGIGAKGVADVIHLGPVSSDGSWAWVSNYYQIWSFQGGITLETGAGGNSYSKNYISAGRGYSTGSGKNGLKLICTEQNDCISGIGQDCTGKAYELSIGAGLGTSGQGYITFTGHKMDSLNSYSEIGHFNFANSTFYVNGKIGVGTTAPSRSLQVEGEASSKGFITCNRGNAYSTSSYGNSALEIREYNFGGAQSDTWGVAPRLSFHWGGRVAAQIGLASNGSLYINNNATASTAFSRIVIEDGGSWNIKSNTSGTADVAKGANVLNINNTMGLSNCLQYVQQSSQTSGNDYPSSTWWHAIKMNHGTGDTYYKRVIACDFWTTNNVYTGNASGNGTLSWAKMWCEGNSVTGAVWNDYAECRQSDTLDAGYVLSETGNDDLVKTTERLQHFAGVSSDTWGFSQGETEKAKTPIAVAGRVLVYPYQDRNNYQPGDCVCAAPGGTVDIMTREEIINYPDRIVGTVSCVPTYEEWGGGELADRDPVKVNGRIWIKVR